MNYVSLYYRLIHNLKEHWVEAGLKIDRRNLVSFDTKSWNTERSHVPGLFLSKAYKNLDEKVRENYISWYW